jgi:hypothetical protein
MPFIPNYDSAAFPTQAEPDAVDFDIILAGIQARGVLSGCAVTAQATPNMTVAVASGSITYDGSTVVVTGGNATISTAHGTYGRLDMVYADTTGAVGVSTGVASNVPVTPSIPSNSVALAVVYVPAGDTAINSNQIVDKRVVIGSTGGKADPFVFRSYGIR